MQKLELNPNKEYFLCGDISMSMTASDKACGDISRYSYMLEKFRMFIKTAEDFDEHGAPTVLLFGENVYEYEHCSLQTIDEKLTNVEFEGFTNLHKVIEAAYNIHKSEKREQASESKFHPGSVMIVFTDGEPTSRAAVKRILQKIITEIDREDEFQIIFLTVGTIAPELQGYLDRLHDDLEDRSINPNDYDIIHVQPLENTTFYGAIGAKDHD